MGGLPETEAALTLWRLAALAHADPETERILLSSGPWSQALAQLGSLDHGRQFLTAWAQFMSEHGHHCRGELELNNARWSENPDYILDLVRGYLRTIDHADPVAKQERLARERLELTAACRARLKNPVKRWIFTWSLKQSQRLAFNREEWKNQAVRFLTFLRRILLELGERLHRDGVLAQRDDIFFLELSEIEPVAAGRAPFDIPSTICSRRRDYDRNLPLRPPPVVVGRYDPITPSEQETSADQDTLTGIPVFPGVVTGSARVILRTDDHEHLQPGEILVAPFTDPAWTPYFVTAAGVVIDQGGILSHGSIVAREYGLPTVTNVGNATRLIRTGDHVQVDGGSGRVRIVRRV
jgi:pyruvate,water dikinase